MLTKNENLAMAAVILAAGKGKRMKSDIPKVLHKVGGRPIIEYVVKTAKSLKVQKVIVVIGRKGQDERLSV